MPGSRPLYFMIKPPPGAAEEIDRVRVEHGIPRGYDIDRLHVTVLRLGDASLFGTTGIAALKQAATTIEAPPFRVNFDLLDGNVLRGSETMLGAIEFQRRLVQVFKDRGIAWDRSFRFRPHITLAYGAGSARHHAIDAIGWLVDELLLVESVHGEARHVGHGRWCLA